MLPVLLLSTAAPVALAGNTAVIGFAGPPPHAGVALGPLDPQASPACPPPLLLQAGQCTDPCAGFAFHPRYHAGFGACVGTSFLQSETGQRHCTTALGLAGTQSRSRQRQVYSARIPDTFPRFATLHDPWSDWSPWSACVADPPEVGSQLILRALICGPADAGYDSFAAADWAKQVVIAEYRGFGASRRCPEAVGFEYWLRDWYQLADQAAGGAGSLDSALSLTWPFLRSLIAESALLKREFDPPDGDGGIPASHALCLQAARKLWPGFSGRVEYLIGSGNVCRVIGLG